jgi:cytochrome P450
VILANALYFFASNPSVYRQLQKHVDRVFPDGDRSFLYEKVRDLPYLEAVINETLRLKPAVPSGQSRVTPREGLQVDEVWIPGDTNVIVPQYVIQRDDRNFPRGEEFIPERWLGEKKRDMVLNEQAFFPFQIGAFSRFLPLPTLRGTRLNLYVVVFS